MQLDGIDVDVVFNAKPEAVPYNYRVSYKVSQVCLILNVCGRAKSCSLIKAQMISYALFSKDNFLQLIDYIEGKRSTPIIRFDPAVNRALLYAMAYGLVNQQKNGNYKLSTKGTRMAEKIRECDEIMQREKVVLEAISKRLTETKIKEIIATWRSSNVTN